MSSPFVFNVAALMRGGSGAAMPEQRTQTGPSPARIGPEMIAVPEGGEVTVDATLTPLGEGLLVDADVTGRLTGQCVRCLRELHPHLDLHVSQVFSDSPDFITGEPDEDGEGGGDDVPEIVGDEIDLLQAVIDEAGLNLPFNPTCEGGCPGDGDSDVPAPDGISGEENKDRVDPRWAGLEKFL